MFASELPIPNKGNNMSQYWLLQYFIDNYNAPGNSFRTVEKKTGIWDKNKLSSVYQVA